MPTETITTHPIPGERRLAKIQVEDELLIRMMQEGFEGNIKTIKGLPDGAVFIASFYEQNTMSAIFIFYHPSFQEVAIGSEIPTIPWSIEHGD